MLVGGCAIAAFVANFQILAAERRGEAGPFTGMHASDGLLALQASLQAIGADPKYKIPQANVAAVRATLVDRPLNAQALSFMGMAAAGPDGNSPATARLMTLAGKITRRDPVSQMWMIEQASAAGDVSGAVGHYHAVLSTNPQLFGTLFPVLDSAIDYPEVQTAVRKYTQANPVWLMPFLGYAAASAKPSSILAVIGSDYAALRDPVYDPINAAITFRLAQIGQSGEALRFAQNAFVDFDHQALREFGVSGVTSSTRLGKLAWALGGTGGVSANLDDSGNVQISSDPLAKGPALARDFVVDPQRQYALTMDMRFASDPKPTAVKWVANCANEGAKAAPWEGAVPASSATGALSFDLPRFAGCSLIHFELQVIGPEGQLPAAFSLKNLALRSGAAS